MKSIFRPHALSLVMLGLATPYAALGGTVSAGKAPATSADDHAGHNHGPKVNLLTGEGVSLGGVLFPHVHARAIYGESTGDLEHLALGHHDPNRDGWNYGQALELGMSGRFNKHFHAFTTMALAYDEEGGWEHHFEEFFGKILELPGGLELRGGRYYNRIGLHNTTHPHGWTSIDQNLLNARFLGEDGLSSTGGELSWNVPSGLNGTSILSVSVGKAFREEHAHEEEEEAEEEGGPPMLHGEEAAFNETVTTLNWTTLYNYNDFHQLRGGFSGVWGKNGWGKSSSVYGVHAEYQWREKGLEAGGSSFRWRTEAMWRDIDGLAEGTEQPLSFNEYGISSAVTYTTPTSFAGPLEATLRADYLQGAAIAEEQDERFRLSPSLRLYMNDARTIHIGLQVNFDHSEEHGNDTSYWLSFGFDWGGREVR